MDNDFDKLFIGGAWVTAAGGDSTPIINPYTEQQIAAVPSATHADVSHAVDAAVTAEPRWRSTPVKERIELLRRVTRLLEQQTTEIAELIVADVGAPLSLARQTHVGYPIKTLEGFCDAAESFPWTVRIGNTIVVWEPVGVAAAITPWNYPLHQATAKVGAALAAGCTVVLKPSDVAPLSLFALAEILDAAGLPAGVFNLVTGPGAVVGEAMVANPNVSIVSFTGSTEVGRQIGIAAARSIKRASLELGGKSPSIVLDDADMVAAVQATAARCFGNSGQTCAALTRLLVPSSRLSEAAEIASAAAEALQLGDPMDPSTTMGPLVSAAQRDTVLAFINSGVAEGAKLVAGGPSAPVPDRGYFVAPTVFSEVMSDMKIARREIFGPVLSIMGYRDEDDAVRMANETDYGLAASVWSGSDNRAVAVASQIKSGLVGVNGGRVNLCAPFGGYKQSGTGREFGAAGIQEFLQSKAVNFTRADARWPAI